jgi:hypothetical protein
MANMRRVGKIFLFGSILIVLGFESSAWAYLDPGAGSMVLQVLLGGIAGVIVILKLYWQRFLGIFRRGAQEDAKNLSSHDRES